MMFSILKKRYLFAYSITTPQNRRSNSYHEESEAHTLRTDRMVRLWSKYSPVFLLHIQHHHPHLSNAGYNRHMR